MDLREMQVLALDVAALYRDLNKEDNGEPWDLEAYALGLVGDTGSLAKAILRAQNHLPPDAEAHDVGHHLADILYSVSVIAHRASVDLEAEFTETMGRLKKDLV